MNILYYHDTEEAYEIDEMSVSGHVATVTGNFPARSTGFTIVQDEKIFLDFPQFRTVYRELEGAVQFSDDGSVWVEPVRDITVSASWNDGDDKEGYRPDIVDIKVDGKKVALIAPDYSKTYKDVPESQDVKITAADDVDKYEKAIEGYTVVYTHELPKEPEEPTLEDRVNDLEIAVCEIADAMAEA